MREPITEATSVMRRISRKPARTMLRWLELVYAQMRINGPYTRKNDGRKHMVIVGDGKKTTISYPKWLMEQHLGRKLLPNETVDHINRDKTDDRIENFRIITRSKHTSEDNPRVKPVEIMCVWCGIKAFKSARDLRGNSKQGKAGPFCSKSCSGKYGAELQNNRTKELEAQPTAISEYYYLEKK